MSNVNVIKVTGISHMVSEELMKGLFEIIGPVLHFDFFPSYLERNTFECIVKFEEAIQVITALHLNNTEFGDRSFKVTLLGSLKSSTSPATANEDVKKETEEEEEKKKPESSSTATDSETGRRREDYQFLSKLSKSRYEYCITIKHISERTATRLLDDRSGLLPRLFGSSHKIVSSRWLENEYLIVEFDRLRDVDRILDGARGRIEFWDRSYSIDDGNYRIPKLIERLERKLAIVPSSDSNKRKASRSRSPPPYANSKSKRRYSPPPSQSNKRYYR